MKTDAANSVQNVMDFAKMHSEAPNEGRPGAVGGARLTLAPEGSGIAGAQGVDARSSRIEEIKDKLKEVIMKLVDKLVSAGDKGGAKGKSVEAIKQAIMDLVELLTKLDDKGSKSEAPGRSPFGSMPPLPSMPNVQSLNSMPKPEFSPMPNPSCRPRSRCLIPRRARRTHRCSGRRRSPSSARRRPTDKTRTQPARSCPRRLRAGMLLVSPAAVARGAQSAPRDPPA